MGLVLGYGVGHEQGRREYLLELPSGSAHEALAEEAPSITPPENLLDNELVERLHDLEQKIAELEATARMLPAANPTPATSSSSPATTTAAAPAPVNEARRCVAITKNGTRCKRQAQSGRDRCWQH
ncbi:MAG: hypothetical protein HJJLKODD_02029 [Phycisphaerae bacterium]|nr:hypothetical protein [Phycisphaerae bacterium]